MGLSYSWKIISLKKTSSEELNDVIMELKWDVVGSDESGVCASYRGETVFSLDNVDSEKFIPYQQLTQKQIVEWIQSSLTEGYKSHIDQQLQKQIDTARKRIVEVTDGKFPWE